MFAFCSSSTYKSLFYDRETKQRVCGIYLKQTKTKKTCCITYSEKVDAVSTGSLVMQKCMYMFANVLLVLFSTEAVVPVANMLQTCSQTLALPPCQTVNCLVIMYLLNIFLPVVKCATGSVADTC